MLPDGAERHLEDWTIFFLNQTPFNTIAPVLALETELSDNLSIGEDGRPELLYVLNLVRTKHDKSVRRCVANPRLPVLRLTYLRVRGAVVKAMAICTRHPFIQIFKVHPNFMSLKSSLTSSSLFSCWHLMTTLLTHPKNVSRVYLMRLTQWTFGLPLH
jgi:hypothetical protein